jgi:hypothetical protein
MSHLDELTKCGICKAELSDPLRLPCHHTFCKECLKSNQQGNKINCPQCKTTHTVQNLETGLKSSLLAKYMSKIKQNYFDSIEIDDDEKNEIEGFCECMPQPNANKKQKEDDNNAVNSNNNKKAVPEPIKAKLSKCFHCSKILCETCRNKHYTQFRLNTLNVLEVFQDGSASVALTSRK